MTTPSSAAERERLALEAVARGPRPTGGRRLTRAELDRLVFHRLFPIVAELLARPDPGPIPGPRSIAV